MVRLLVAALVVAACMAVATTPAQARGYSCSYAKDSITAALDGYDMSSYFCRVFNSEFGGRRVYWNSGRARCAWQSRSMDVRVTVFTRSATLGQIGCAMLSTQIPRRDWRRLY